MLRRAALLGFQASNFALLPCFEMQTTCSTNWSPMTLYLWGNISYLIEIRNQRDAKKIKLRNSMPSDIDNWFRKLNTFLTFWGNQRDCRRTVMSKTTFLLILKVISYKIIFTCLFKFEMKLICNLFYNV